MINVGILAKTYHLLPSQVLANATTYDIMITDVLTTWENYKNNPENMDNYKTEDLEKLIRNTR
ncbi:MAG: hypothetical protein ACO3EY_07410 [Candidatus Nanopelagicales bacterium]|jgi:hypothetical protein